MCIRDSIICLQSELKSIRVGLYHYYSRIHPVHYIHDAEQCYQPSLVRPRHCGEHIRSLNSTKSCDAFRKFATDLKRSIEAWSMKNEEPYCVVISDYCGRYKSVSWARTTGMMLTGDYQVKVEHLSRDKWYTHTCKSCESCKLDGYGKEDMCRMMVAFYSDL